MSHKPLPARHDPLPSREDALYRLCFEATPQAVLIFDLAPDGTPARIRACNEAAERLLGYAGPELRRRTVLELTEGDDRRAMAQSLRDLLMVEAGTWEATLRTATGRTTVVTADGVLFEDEGQRATLLQLCAHDPVVAQRRRPGPSEVPALFSRRAISFLESRPGEDIYPLIAAGLGELVGDASVLLTSCDERAGLLTVREATGPVRHWIRFARTIGLNPSRVELPRSGFYRDMLGRGTLIRVKEGLFDMCFGAVPRVICQTAEKMFGIGRVYAMGICRRGVLHGTVVVLTRRNEPIENPDIVEAFANLAAVALHRQQAMDELAESQSKLLRIERLEAMGRLASGLAHDFNNLLTLILGNGDLVKRSLPETDPRRRLVEKIISAARRAASLTNQLLAFSRRDPSAPAFVELDPILAELEPMLQGLAGERRRFVLRLSSGPEDAHVLIHPSQVDQIAMNLVSNACDAMLDGGEVVVRTRRVVVETPLPASTGLVPAGDYITLSVSDTGVGMSPDTEAQIFEPFFTTKPKQKGTGLGLSTVYGIVEQSNGHIQIETAQDRGTRVTVYLPHATAEQRDAPPATHVTAPPQTAAAPTVATGSTVLLAEDQEFVRDVAGTMLRELGYQVLAAGGGEEALRLAASHDGTLELLVTDVVMPGLTGPELAHRLTDKRPETRVLFISGCTDGSTLRQDMLPAPAAFLPKPFTRSDLQTALDALLAKP
jgi:PAS domain S-box-containing protein